MRTPLQTAVVLLLVGVASPAPVAGGTGSDAARIAHEGVDCSRCHAASRSGAPAGATTGATDGSAGEACVGCHATQSASGSGVLQSFHGQSGRACSDCHSFHDPEMLRAGGKTFAFEFGHAGLDSHCGTCHSGSAGLDRLSPGHREAADAYHAGSDRLARISPSEACLACHSNRATPEWIVAVPASTPRFHDAASHKTGIPVPLGKGDRFNHIRYALDARIRLFDGKIECQTCHEITRDTDDLLVEFETDHGVCLGCHQFERPGREDGSLIAERGVSGRSR